MKRRSLVIALIIAVGIIFGGSPLKSYAEDRYAELQTFSKI